jgi:hypothetical protein
VRAALLLALSGLGACSVPARVGAHCAGEPAFRPFDEAAVTPHPAPPPDGALDALMALYQHHGRAHDLPGIGCPFAPTCSAYARESLHRYGPFAIVLIVDRLIVREHQLAARYYPTICVHHTLRLADAPP